MAAFDLYDLATKNPASSSSRRYCSTAWDCGNNSSPAFERRVADCQALLPQNNRKLHAKAEVERLQHLAESRQIDQLRRRNSRIESRLFHSRIGLSVQSVALTKLRRLDSRARAQTQTGRRPRVESAWKRLRRDRIHESCARGALRQLCNWREFACIFHLPQRSNRLWKISISCACSFERIP